MNKNLLRRVLLFLWMFVFEILCSGCFGSVEGLYPPGTGEELKSVYVVDHNGWHTGIAVKRQDIPDNLWPEHQDFADFEYVEVGWGDRAYYQASEPTLWITMKAALWPTPSVLHIIGFNGLVQRYFPESKIVEIALSHPGFERLCRFIQDSYARDDLGKAIRLGSGLYKHSQFYLGRENFHLLKTCNVWTAKAIRSAGCPITPLYAITAGNVIRQGKKCGKMIQTGKVAYLLS
jgi:uncharacterized protein (TIGR02117 family)